MINREMLQVVGNEPRQVRRPDLLRVDQRQLRGTGRRNFSGEFR